MLFLDVISVYFMKTTLVGKESRKFLILFLDVLSVSSMKIITIHHERPCRIEISHPRGQKFNQGRGLPSPWLNSDPKGEISLSYMDRLMMDCFSPTF